jgi:methionyl-tRNA synthetase
MVDRNKKFYITTTLPYVNSEPHLGFALEIIQADVIARWKREQGYEVFFNTGTDEHGLKILRKSEEEGLKPQEFCDKNAKKFDNLKAALNLTYNNFIRTTDPHHIKAAQEFWLRCFKNGDIYKKNYKIKYCVGCELEKTDSELVKGRCPIHPKEELEIIEEENYFFRYSRYQDRLLKLYNDNPQFVIPDFRLDEIKKFTKRGLQDFSISRLKEKLPWGVPVPGDDKHTIYVWFDALVNYISSLGWPDDLKKFNSFWPGLQVAGKDNLRQQSSMWQAMLMSSKLPTSEQILIHGFVTSGGHKMSKSLGNVINPFELVKKYGTDAVRYFLLKEISPFKDGDFTIKRFEERYNSDLASGIGNLVSRILKLAENFGIKRFESLQTFPFLTEDFIDIEKTNYNKALKDFKFNEALSAVWRLISKFDKFIEKEKPWEKKESSEKVVMGLLSGLSEIASLLSPFLPETSERIKGQLREKEREPLFPRLRD